MRKAGFIIFSVFIFFLIEFFLFNLVGRVFMPNLLLLIIIFFVLFWGVRYGLLAAVWGGLLKDSFSIGTFGIYIFSFVFCAYMATILSKYIYRKGSEISRFLLVLAIAFVNVFVHYILRMMFSHVNFSQAIQFILVPEILTTLLVSIFIFEFLRKCVLKSSALLL